ncbi:conserved membrane hypothetical protein [Tenacibaculum sp. 190524A05c]|uniref:DCC1-like thiol-disulfide oxidoreductase family protein n=1 Tax=Tenacibaculum platacis TaxID=3137852 RepID=UPI0031FB8430
MKTLNNHTILYDEDCPLCKAYTSTFINTKMLDKEGRKPYCEITEHEREFIDVPRAANEIALVDTEKNEVIYGIDSLLKVIGFSFPLVEKVGNIKLVKFFLKRLYSFISYNRKVIMPSEKKEENSLECSPSFNLKYRLFYIVFGLIITVFTLFHFSDLITILPKSSYYREILLALGMLLSQYMFVLKEDHQTRINYIGNVITVSLFGCIALSQLLILNSLIELSQFIIFFGFSGTVALMFFEHKRRIRLLQLPTYLSWTWIGYRLVIGMIILNV